MVKRQLSENYKKEVKRQHRSLYNEQIKKIIENLVEEGKNQNQICKSLGVDKKTLTRWASKNPDLRLILDKDSPNATDKSCQYLPEIHPKMVSYLKKIGYSSEAVAKELGVGRNVLYDWANKYPDFKAAMSINKGALDNEILNALLARTKSQKTKKTKIIYDVFIDAEGTRIEREIRREVLEEEIPADLAAIKLWFFNRDKTNWSAEEKEVLPVINITEAQQKVKDTVTKLEKTDQLELNKIISKIPADIIKKYVETGSLESIATYMIENNLEVKADA